MATIDASLWGKITASPIKSIDPVLVSRSEFTGAEFVRSRTAHRYGFDITWGNISKAEARQLSGFFGSLRGRYGTFTYVHPLESYPTSGASLSMTVKVAGGSQVGTSLDVDGLTDGAFLNQGDKFVIAGDSKVYEVAEDCTASGGAATIELTHPMRKIPSDNAIITYSSVPFTLRLSGDEYTIQMRPGEIYSFSVTAEEAY